MLRKMAMKEVVWVANEGGSGVNNDDVNESTNEIN